VEVADLNNDDPMLIQDYDPSWPEAFSKLAARVTAALGSLVVTIEHVGSTAAIRTARRYTMAVRKRDYQPTGYLRSLHEATV
jgi:GrpB protein